MTLNSDSLYEILGVSEEATPEELKRAYRQLAQLHHPDRGGDHEQFIQISRAYRVLNDPGSRLLYDKTGKPEPIQMDKEVEDVLLQAFNDALGKNAKQILVHARTWIQSGEQQMMKQKEEILQQRIRLQEKRDLIQTKGDKNLIHQLIDQNLKNIEFALIEIERKFEIAKNCYLALDNYLSTETDPYTKPTYAHSLGSIFIPDYSDIITELQRSVKEEQRRRGGYNSHRGDNPNTVGPAGKLPE